MEQTAAQTDKNGRPYPTQKLH